MLSCLTLSNFSRRCVRTGLFLMYAVLVFPITGYTGQDMCRVTVSLHDLEKDAIIGAFVEIEETELKAISDINGEVVFFLHSGKDYTVHVRYMGFEEVHLPVSIPRSSSHSIDIVLQASTISLEQILVMGKSQEQTVKELPYKPQVISLNNLRAQPLQIPAILNQLPGVRIRQEGGLGSNANIMLNGIDGKGVKIFIDGLPVYLLGAGYNINTLSPNMIDRLEVYRGTIPVDFGSDALGGVINIVSRHEYKEFLETSYSFGSWNTHESSLSLRKTFGKADQFYVDLDGFYNYSDNDYWMDDVNVVEEKVNFNVIKGRARRFNDQFRSYVVRGKFGARNLPWADEISLHTSRSDVFSEVQHGLRAEKPWGEAFFEQRTTNLSANYRKFDSKEKWSVNLTTGFTHDVLEFVDTTRRNYYWDQNYQPKPPGTAGESGIFSMGNMPVIQVNSFFLRQNFNYSIHANHTLNLTHLLTKDNVDVGNGVLSTDDQTRLEPLQELFKNYVGLALESKVLGERLSNTLSVKHFFTESDGLEYNVYETDKVGGMVNTNTSILGYGNVLRFNIRKNFSSFIGYEYTVRQPDREELFGDYQTIVPNPYLRPEVSQNLNIGLEMNSKSTSIQNTLSFFYRDTQDRIFLNAVASIQSQYENLLGTQGAGVEFQTTYRPIKPLSIVLNATYQDITLKDIGDNSLLRPRHLGERVPNIPYLFGNGQFTYSQPIRSLRNSTISAVYHANYIQNFYPTWDEGLDQAEIPTQFIHNASLSCMSPSERWSVGFECRNITNTKAYDNFFVQLPGRSYFMKLRLFLTKKNNSY